MAKYIIEKNKALPKKSDSDLKQTYPNGISKACRILKTSRSSLNYSKR
jgi:hypothetical protein